MNEEQKAKPEESGGNNKTLIVILIIIGVLVVLAVLGRYAIGYLWDSVGDRASQEIGEEITERAIEESSDSDEDVNVELNEEEWPSDLATKFQYPDSTIVSSSSFESGEQKSSVVSMESSDSSDDVYDYYVGLADDGWEVGYKFKSSRSDTDKTASVSLTKDQTTVAVGIQEGDEAGSEITLTVSTE